MDRTISIKDNCFFFQGIKKQGRRRGFSAKAADFPVSSDSAFTLKRKIICPKQVNDTVTVFFDGEYSGLRLYAGKKMVFFETDSEGREIFDITSALKTGITHITATFDKGQVRDFFLSVKRNFE